MITVVPTIYKYVYKLLIMHTTCCFIKLLIISYNYHYSCCCYCYIIIVVIADMHTHTHTHKCTQSQTRSHTLDTYRFWQLLTLQFLSALSLSLSLCEFPVIRSDFDSEILSPPGNDEIKEDQWMGVTVRSNPLQANGSGGKVSESKEFRLKILR